jgi:hypothetical protein
VNLGNGTFVFNDVVINNPNDYSSADGLKIRELSCKMPLYRLFKQMVTIEHLTMDFSGFTSVCYQGQNNLDQFIDQLRGSFIVTKFLSQKGFLIHTLNVKFTGVVGIRHYHPEGIRLQDFALSKISASSEVCHNVPPEQQEDFAGNAKLSKVLANVLSSWTNEKHVCRKPAHTD